MKLTAKSVFLGAVSGTIVWIFLKALAAGTNLLWEVLPGIFDTALYTLIICTLGGLITGLFRKWAGDYPEEMMEVLGKVKKEKFYDYTKLPLLLVAAFLPLVFASSVGPEAGLVGIITALCYWVSASLKMEGMLCFMLFAGSCHMRLLDFKKHAKIVSLLAVGATLIGAVFYGVLFYVISQVLGLDFTLPMCLMFGSIVAPTDQIVATSILKKFNLPSNIGFIIEGESLLNDGVGVALFVCFSGMISAQKNGGFFSVMFKEIFGAVLIGVAVTVICFPIFKRSKDVTRQIFTSLLAVASAYFACEHFGFCRCDM